MENFVIRGKGFFRRDLAGKSSPRDLPKSSPGAFAIRVGCSQQKKVCLMDEIRQGDEFWHPPNGVITAEANTKTVREFRSKACTKTAPDDEADGATELDPAAAPLPASTSR
jgi:hypothetical protein